MSAARFVTHLRYLFVRLNSGTQLQTMPTELLHGITNAHPLAASVSKKVALLIELGNPVQLTAEEVAYLTLHVARLIADLEGEAT